MKNTTTKINKIKIINSFILDTKRQLFRRQKINYWAWASLSLIIMVINFIILAASIYILILIIDHYRDNPNQTDYLKTIAGPAMLLLISLLSFIFFLILAIFNTRTKRSLYKNAFRDLQFETIKFKEKVEEYNKKTHDRLFKNKILKIKRNVKVTKRDKLTWKNLLRSMLLKDSNA